MKTMNTARNRYTVLSLLILALLLLSLGVAAADEEAAAGKKTDFRLKSIDGKTLGPKDFHGKVVVVDFWATWCVPCHWQSEILASVYKDTKGKPIQFLAANVSEEEAIVRKFLQKNPMPYPVLLDPGDVSADLGVYALPSVLVIDKKGKAVFFRQGVVDDPTLRKILKQNGV